MLTIAELENPRYFLYHTCPLHTNSGYRKRHEYKITWFTVKPEKAAAVIGTALRATGPVPADSRP